MLLTYRGGIAGRFRVQLRFVLRYRLDCYESVSCLVRRCRT